MHEILPLYAKRYIGNIQVTSHIRNLRINNQYNPFICNITIYNLIIYNIIISNNDSESIKMCEDNIKDYKTFIYLIT